LERGSCYDECEGYNGRGLLAVNTKDDVAWDIMCDNGEKEREKRVSVVQTRSSKKSSEVDEREVEEEDIMKENAGTTMLNLVQECESQKKTCSEQEEDSIEEMLVDEKLAGSLEAGEEILDLAEGECSSGLEDDSEQDLQNILRQ